MIEPHCLLIFKINLIFQASKQHRLKRYHSQTYVNGSKCDLNGNPREAEVRVRHHKPIILTLHSQFLIVRFMHTVTLCPFLAHSFLRHYLQFMCEEGSVDYLARVDEPQSCRYVLTVHTSRVCQHPFLRPPSTAKPQSIVCQPALSAQQYMDYVKAQVCELKRI